MASFKVFFMDRLLPIGFISFETRGTNELLHAWFTVKIDIFDDNDRPEHDHFL